VWVKAPQTFARRVDADAWLARQRTALEDRVLRPAVLARRMTLQGYADAWLRDRRSASGQPLRPSTRRVYEHYLVKLIYPELGEVLLTELTPAIVNGWYRRLVPDRPTLRARTYALLRGVLTTAIEDELIAVNPCRVRGASNARPATQTVVASPAQVNELAAAMPAPLAAAVQIGAWCQLRNGEVLELRRKDLTAGAICVRRGVTWTRSGAHVGPPKTDAGVRTVSIPPHVRPVLAAHLGSFVPDDPEALLFSAAPGSTEHMRQTTFAYHFKRAVPLHHVHRDAVPARDGSARRCARPCPVEAGERAARVTFAATSI
jgi:integrase